MAQLIILGIIQGLTEFLPISSSAHLVFAEHFLHVARPGILIEALLHLGTTVALIVLLWPDVRRLLLGFFSVLRRPRVIGRGDSGAYGRLALLILLTTIVTSVIGLAFQKQFEAMFTSVRATAVQLIITGFILLLARERNRRGMLTMGTADAAVLGVAQGIAIIPGISRSGIVIVGGLWMGFAREDAALLSLLTAIPALLGVALLSLKDVGEAAVLGYGPLSLLAGFAAAVVFGGIAVRWLLDIARRDRFRVFSLYCWVVGVAVVLSTFR